MNISWWQEETYDIWHKVENNLQQQETPETKTEALREIILKSKTPEVQTFKP